MTELDDLRYPIGKHNVRAPIDAESVKAAIRDIRELPDRLAAAIAGLNDKQLDTVYRPGGWTVRQVVHHLPDSHVNAYTRLKLALTEDVPVIKTYDEEKWAELRDGKSLPVEPSLSLIKGLHSRWTSLLEGLGEAEFQRELMHPDAGKFSIAQLTGLYGWHSRHHVAHITSLRHRSGW
jgi:DinB family protein